MDNAMQCVSFTICMLFLHTASSFTGDGDSYMTIGSIVNGGSKVERMTFSKYSHNISLVWLFVDTSEIYQIFRAKFQKYMGIESMTSLSRKLLVQTLDAQTDIDLIMMFDYEPPILSIPQILETRNKKLIMWGEKLPGEQQMTNTAVSGKDIGQRELYSTDLCGDEYIPELLYDDLYCQTDVNNTQGIGENSSFTLTAPRAVTSLIQKLKWKTVTIIHENATEHEANDLVDTLSRNGKLFSIFNIDLIDDLHMFLQKAYFTYVPSNQRLNIVVLCRFFCARRIFRTANQFDSLNVKRKTLLKQFSRWLVAVYGHSKGVSRALQACANDLDNVAIIAIPEFSGAGTQDFYNILDKIMYELFIYNEEWHGKLNAKEYITDQLVQQAATWNPVSRCLGYNIDTLLWTNGGRYFSSVGYMDRNGQVVVKSEIFPNTKYGYNKRKFLVSILPYEPFIFKKYINGTPKYEGFCLDLLNELAHTLNFTYELTEPADQKWGSFISQSNNTFNGLVGQLQREEVDMTAAPLSVTALREQVVDFTNPFYYEYTTVVTKKPDGNATKWRTLVDPFKWEVLLSIGLSLPVVTTLVFLLEKYNPFYKVEENAEARANNDGLHSWVNSFWYMYGALLCQGGVHLPDSITGRTLVSFWWMFCIIVVGTYCGNLIAFLTVTKEKAPFDTLDELARAKGTYTWGTLAGTHWELVFTTSKTPSYHKIGEGLKEFNRSDPEIMNPDPAVHIQKVLRGGYAWIGDKTVIESAMTMHCDLIRMKEEFLPLRYAIGFPNMSPHVQAFSGQMMKIHEGGLLEIWKRMWWPKANFCADKTVREAKPITLIDVQSAFYVCLVGIFIGTVAFFLEICLNRYRMHKAKKKKMDTNTHGNGVVQNAHGHSPVATQN